MIRIIKNIKPEKKVIRNGTFETNSSSVHTISIIKRRHIPKEIPSNSVIICNGTLSFYDETVDGEVGKLNYLVQLFASLIEQEDEEVDMYFHDMIGGKYFSCLKEIIKKERSTEVVFEKEHDSFPYYETTSDEERSIKEIIGLEYFETEESLMERCREIIFDNDIVIIDKDNEY